MIFGNAAWGFRDTPLEEQLRITRDMGLNVLELGIANAPLDIPLDVSNDRLSEIQKLADSYGITLLCGATGNDFTTGSEDVEKVKRVIDICSDLGLRYLRIFAGFRALSDVTEEIFRSMLDSLNIVCNYAESKAVVPVIETHGGVMAYEDGVEHIKSITTEADSVKRILKNLPESVRICYDPANLYAAGHKHPEVFYQELKDKIGYAHLKDFKTLPGGHLRPSFCGDSDMDWEPILFAMKGFEGAALFEYENTEDIEEGLKKSYQYIKERVENE